MKIVEKVLDFFGYSKNADSKEDYSSTSSYAESPDTYIFDQFKVATDRINTIRDVRELVKSDLRFKMTNLRIGADATRGGFKVVVAGSETDRKARQKKGKPWQKRLTPGANTAQSIIEDFLTRTKLPYKMKGYTRALLRDGDLFLNPVVNLNQGLILDIKMAPSITIKRNSDEYGQFPDIERAFSQIDPLTQINTLMEIGPPSSSRTDFALYQMNHIRWLWDETTNYGTSQYASARLTHKILLRMEKAAAIRREFRSVDRRGHKLPESAQESDIQKYMRDVRLIDAKGNPTRNAHLLSDFVGTADVKSLNDGATNLDQMGDIKYFDNLLWLDLLVPKPILTAGEDINRDILKVQYPQYLKSLEDITDTLEYGDPGAFSGIRDIIDLQLLLQGINPQSIKYDIVWVDKSVETALERIERVQTALGSGGGVKIITKEKAIQEIADDFDIEDPQAMAKLIEEEEARQQVQSNHNPKEKIKEKEDIEENQEDKESITDVLQEDLSKIEKLEKNTQTEVMRFFNAVFQKMLKEESITDSIVIIDSISEEDILSALDDAWEELIEEYRPKLVNQMTNSFMIGADRAFELAKKRIIEADEKDKEKLARINLNFRIFKKDIYSYLLKESGTRIRGIKETTRNQIREDIQVALRK